MYEVQRAYPDIWQHFQTLVLPPSVVNVNDLLALAQVLHSNHMLHVKVALNVNDVGDIKELLKAYPNMGQCNVHLSVHRVTVNVSDLLQLAQVMYNNPTLHIIGELRVNIDNRRDTEGLAEVLRTYPNMEQYIFCSVNASDLPLLLHSNHIIPQVKVTVMICDEEDIKVVDEILKEHPDMHKYISLSFPEHPSRYWRNLKVMNCLPSRVDKIKREYPDYIQNIDSIFSPSLDE